MYGFINHALESLVLRKFGEESWQQIKERANVHMDGHFLLRVVYEDNITFDLVQAATEILGVGANEVLELFGEFFVSFCQESGYERILHTLGGKLFDFIQNLDALHDHLGTVYPGMQAPSFRVTSGEDGVLVLHYYSSRQGLESIVVGILKAVARRLLNTEIEMQIIKHKEASGDHVQFAIREISCSRVRSELQVVPFDALHGPAALRSEHKIAAATCCRAFPFHVLFDRKLKVLQAGNSVSRVVMDIGDGKCTLTDVFEMVRPQMVGIAFESILVHINTVFVLRTRDGRLKLPRSARNVSWNGTHSPKSSEPRQPSLRLKGQMMHSAKRGRILFLCSPSVGNLDDLRDAGLFLGDIPIYGATRDLILLSEQFKEDYGLAKQLEILTDQLRQTHRALAEEKKMTDELLYSVLPASVANELRQKRPVKAQKFDMVTILFSGIVEFSCICKNAKPMEIVQLLNDMYTRFDEIQTEARDVYKVETVGDKYMAVSGLPDRCVWHARSVCCMALSMIDVVKHVTHNGKKVQVQIGIHSGEVVAGVVGHKTPRYCLFGNTVNLTSRTETTGLPGQVNITEHTYRCLQEPVGRHPSFLFKQRGPVHMKGCKEPLVTYLLSRDPAFPRPAGSTRPGSARDQPWNLLRTLSTLSYSSKNSENI